MSDGGKLRADPRRQWRRGAGIIGTIALLLAAGLISPLAPTQDSAGRFAPARADAAAAVRALKGGDLLTLEKALAAKRGQTDFAYYFTSEATPRMLGDALAAAAPRDKELGLASDIDPHTYNLLLADLAGTVALATHGKGHRTLPSSWTDDFVAATTTPEALYRSRGKTVAARERADQDVANKQNLLLLISRGYWSGEFLETLTAAFLEFDRASGGDAWPSTVPNKGRYAPAANGKYLTDGILALSAALTANPAASRWAFTEFQPGTHQIEGSDYSIGNFTHYLMFEHQFPESSNGASIGMTSTLTALSAAIDASSSAGTESVSITDLLPALGASPMFDSIVLQGLAHDPADGSGCSWNPLDYVSCVVGAARSVWQAVRKWGHTALDILSLATFAPPPFTVIGTVAAGTNATWYAVQGDYAEAGLALAAAVPGLAFNKIAKVGSRTKSGSRETLRITKVADEDTNLAAVATRYTPGAKGSQARIEAEAGASKVLKSPRPGYSLERQAQDELADTISGARVERTLDPGCTRTACFKKRDVDVYVEKSRLCIEVKSGYGKNLAFSLSEVERDRRLRKNRTCKAVVWHFFPDARGLVGPDPRLREALRKARKIPYVMYEP